MSTGNTDRVQLLPIVSIKVLNPRDRNTRKFREIVDSISKVGLKRPITVSPLIEETHEERFELVCGQGRLEAMKLLEQTEIPAIIIDTSREDRFLMSLVENFARRYHTPLELMRDIGTLFQRGYSKKEIAEKIGVTPEWVSSILHLMHNGEERLLAAVERNQIPISVAVEIADADDGDMQRALSEAYERNQLRGNRLAVARRILQTRQRQGKGLRRVKSMGNRKRKFTANAMVLAYKKEAERQRAMIKKSNLTEHRLMFLTNALKELFTDENFMTLLRAEGLDTVPRQIVDLVDQSRQIS